MIALNVTAKTYMTPNSTIDEASKLSNLQTHGLDDLHSNQLADNKSFKITFRAVFIPNISVEYFME